MPTTSQTTLEDFFLSLTESLSEGLGISTSRFAVVDKVRLESDSAPNYQFEPVSLSVLGDNTGLNIFKIEYRIHVIQSSRSDFGTTSRNAMTLPASAFHKAVGLAGQVGGLEPYGSDRQVFVRVDNGGLDEESGLYHASAFFYSYIKLTPDGV